MHFIFCLMKFHIVKEQIPYNKSISYKQLSYKIKCCINPFFLYQLFFFFFPLYSLSLIPIRHTVQYIFCFNTAVMYTAFPYITCSTLYELINNFTGKIWFGGVNIPLDQASEFDGNKHNFDFHYSCYCIVIFFLYHYYYYCYYNYPH